MEPSNNTENTQQIFRELVDLEDKSASFKKIEERLVCLRSGFYALSLDYSFHIENTSGTNHKIIQLRDNVIYRCFSSAFHFQLLLKEHVFIDQRFSELRNRSPAELSEPLFGKNPHTEYAEKSISAIFDSIVYHLASIYDYLAILVNFITIQDKDQTPKWSQICKIARTQGNPFGKLPIAALILAIDRDFVNKLYEHRSDLIHTKIDINEYYFEFQQPGQSVASKLICSPKIRKAFKEFGDKHKDYTVSYFSVWVIEKATETIASILKALKLHIEKSSKFPFHHYKDGSKPIIMYLDPQTNTAKSPGIIGWDTFFKQFS